MKRKTTKMLAIGGMILAVLAAIGISLIVFFAVVCRVGDPRRSYAQRYVECDGRGLMRTLEKVFAIDFPKNMDEPKAAKTNMPIGGSILFLLKFCAEPNEMGQFIETLGKTTQGSSIDWTAYDQNVDGRGRHTWPVPGWFTQPIEKGDIGEYSLSDRRMTIYVDTGHKEYVVVYIKGWFLKKYGQDNAESN